MNNNDSSNIVSDSLYTLYTHTCLANDKVYVGITYKNAKQRWDEGDGYKSNYELYSDIVKYGWKEGFHHKIVADNLSWEKAKESERFFIEIYDSTNPEKGYNHRKGGIGYGAHRNRETNIGEKLKTLRKKKDVTQAELADYLGVHRSTVANYELDRRLPSMVELKMISDYFGVSIDYFADIKVENPSFEISSRVIDYFKKEDFSADDKAELFNDIISAYYLYVLDKK